MFKDFRKQVDDTPFSLEHELDDSRHSDAPDASLTPTQRFAVALLVLMMTAVIGVLFLLANAKIALPG